MPDDVTLGELARRMDALHDDIRELRSSIVEHDDLSSVATAWQAALAAQDTNHMLLVGQLRRDVEDLQSWQMWATRLVVGAVILGVLGLLLDMSNNLL